MSLSSDSLFDLFTH